MSDMLQRMRYMEQLYIKFGGDEQVLFASRCRNDALRQL